MTHLNGWVSLNRKTHRWDKADCPIRQQQTQQRQIIMIIMWSAWPSSLRILSKDDEMWEVKYLLQLKWTEQSHLKQLQYFCLYSFKTLPPFPFHHLTHTHCNAHTQMTDYPVAQFQWSQSKQTATLLLGRTLSNDHAGFVNHLIRSCNLSRVSVPLCHQQTCRRDLLPR